MKQFLIMLLLLLGISMTMAQTYPVYVKKHGTNIELVYKTSEYPELYESISKIDSQKVVVDSTEIEQNTNNTIVSKEEDDGMGWGSFFLGVVATLFFLLLLAGLVSG